MVTSDTAVSDADAATQRNLEEEIATLEAGLRHKKLILEELNSRLREQELNDDILRRRTVVTVVEGARDSASP